VRAVPELRAGFPLGFFLSPRTAAVDVGLLGLALAARRPLAALAAVPWAVESWRAADGRPGRPRAVRAAQVMAGDVVGLVGLLRGSVAARRWVL
jgi:hypothetical protein